MPVASTWRVWLWLLGDGCSRHLTAATKKAPAKVLKLERSVGSFENFKCVLVMLGSGCHRRFPAAPKKAPAKVLKLERSGGCLRIFECVLSTCEVDVVGTSQPPQKKHQQKF